MLYEASLCITEMSKQNHPIPTEPNDVWSTFINNGKE